MPLLDKGDCIIDGGNSYYIDDIRRAKELSAKGIDYVDVGTTRRRVGPRARLLHDDRRTRCGGETARSDLQHARARAWATSRARPAGRTNKGTAERGYLHCGPSGAGHFVKMVHNGIEYGMMAAYAEGLGVLKSANIGKRHARDTTPKRRRCAIPKHYQYDLDLRRDHRSVAARQRDRVVAARPDRAGASSTTRKLSKFAGRVSDSGEGRWTIKAAIDEAVPAPVLTAALYARFSSRGEAEFQNKVLSAMRFGFGGHLETPKS